MAHQQQHLFIQIISNHVSSNGFKDKKVLEIGSYDVNGSIRHLFENSEYTGVDLTEGPGVDIVCDAHKLALDSEFFDISLSCECFEHNPEWLKTFLNMYRMTKKGGILAFTCATTGRLEHGTTRTSPSSSPGTQSIGWDYYLNLTEKDFRKKIDFGELFEDYLFMVYKKTRDLYFVGKKNGRTKLFEFDSASLRNEYLKEVCDLEREMQQPSPYPKIIRQLGQITLLPIRISMFLPDRQFQNFAYYYIRFHRAFKSRIKSALLSLIGDSNKS